MKIRVLLAYGVSLLGFVASLLKPDSVWLVLPGAPFFVLLCATIHEGGHCIGCLGKGNEITEIGLPFLKIRKRKLITTSEMTSYCKFKKGKSDVFIYALGPVFSLIHAAIWLGVYMRIGNIVTFIYLTASTLVFLINMLPVRNNDLQKIIEELELHN